MLSVEVTDEGSVRIVGDEKNLRAVTTALIVAQSSGAARVTFRTPAGRAYIDVVRADPEKAA